MLVGQRVPALVGAETTLRADADPLQGFFTCLVRSFGHKLRGLVDSLLHLLLVFQVPHFGADTANDDIFVLGQILQGLEASRPFGVVFEVERVDVEVLEQFLSDNIIRSLGEVPPANEVASAQMHSRMHVCRQLGDGVVVQGDIGVQKVICSPDVVWVVFPAIAEILGAEI